jgi:long-subunit fatty acid transport protein
MTKLKRISIITLVFNTMLVCGLFAQAYNVPLTMEGLNHVSNASVVSQAMGGVTIPLQKDISIMFVNPASLSTLDALTVSVGGSRTYTSANQTQTWQPDTYWGNFTLLMDGSARTISPSDSSWHKSHPGVPTPTFPGDTLWKPYDNLGPNWSRTKDAGDFLPDIFVGLPVTVAGIKATVGVGMAEYANLDYYYQNNNVITPEYDLLQVGEGLVKGDSVKSLNWSQSIHQRNGKLHSYGGAVSVNITDNFSAGLSARYISGSTNDQDLSVGRGVIKAYSAGYVQKYWNVAGAYGCIRLDSVDYMSSLTGTSDFSGYDATLSTTYRSKNVTVGLVITLPSVIAKKFNGQIVNYAGQTIDYAANYQVKDTSYTQNMDLPWKAKIGLGMQVRPNVLFAAEYEYSPYSTADLERPGYAKTVRPWLDASSFHFGVDWQPINILSLRFGYRRQSDVFQPQYAAFNSDPVSYNAYSAGFGVELMPGLALNAAYEFYEFKYEDTWVDNSNVNILTSNTFSAALKYTIH